MTASTSYAPPLPETTQVLLDKRVLRVWSPLRPASAWAYLEDLGWRKIPATTADGDTAVLDACCRARTEGLRVRAVTTAHEILQLQLVATP
jgi:hypothetical protein